MRFKKIIKLFETGNVCVTGLKGRGKDMLMSNVVYRRKMPYVCNVDYHCNHSEYHKLVMTDFDVHNTYDNFMSGNVNSYVFPFPDKTDIYVSDSGVYFPSHYCNELNKKYQGFINFMALSRHLGDCSVHTNSQNLNRIWDKVREQSDTYIFCNKCIYFFGFVLQLVTIYELADSCIKRVPPFAVQRPMFNKDRLQEWELAYNKYTCTYGKVDRRILFYRCKSKYDTRFFKTLLSTNVE